MKTNDLNSGEGFYPRNTYETDIDQAARERQKKIRGKNYVPRVTKEVVTTFLDVLKYGLVSGVGDPIPGKMCVEAAACFALGLPHGDEPTCVHEDVRNFKIQLNDSHFSSPKARARALRRLGVVQLGTTQKSFRGGNRVFKDKVRHLALTIHAADALQSWTKTKTYPKVQAASIKAILKNLRLGTRESMAANVKLSAGLSRPVKRCVRYLSYQFETIESGSPRYDDDVFDAVSFLFEPVGKSWYSLDLKTKKRMDRLYANYAERVVQILIDLKAPGAKYLYMTEKGYQP